MAGISSLFTEQFTPLKQMSRKDLQLECETWRRMWEWVDEETKYYLGHIGELTRLVERNYHGVLGTMLQPKFELKSIEIGTWEKEFSQVDGKYYMEKKTAKIPSSNIIKVEFLQERSLVEEIDNVSLDELLVKST